MPTENVACAVEVELIKIQGTPLESIVKILFVSFLIIKIYPP